MTPARLQEITSYYSRLRIAIVGDFCLDRYLEISPSRTETSIETGLPVHNVVNVRAQPGAAGTILNNLVALGVGEILPVGFCGEDGEGYELRRALSRLRGVGLSHFIQTPQRRTFTYCKPLVLEPGMPPRELSRLDTKNWEPTPSEISKSIAASIATLTASCDAMIVMDQVDIANTGVVTNEVLEALRTTASVTRRIPILADSRRGLHGYPPLIFKMNAAELSALSGQTGSTTQQEIESGATHMAAQNGRMVFVTMAERGIVGASPEGLVEHVPALPVRGPIDVVGAGDSVTANLTAALASQATPREAMALAMLASSLVVHQLGTSGSASAEQIASLLARAGA